jgi:hypothetical protein
MDNHYHLLVETTTCNLSVGMRQINGVYTQYFNRRYERVGHVFQGRFKAILVERESYLLELCRYVVLNPVRTDVAGQPDDYAWSSYPATAGIEEPPRFLAVHWVLSQFGNDRPTAQQRYRDFVSEGIGKRKVWEDLKSQCILGSSKFLAKIGPALKGKAPAHEIPRLQRMLLRPSLEELFALSGSSGKKARNELMKKANLEYEYSFSEIGRYLGLHYATVSRIVRDK